MNFVLEKLRQSDNQKINKIIRDIDVQFFEISDQKTRKNHESKFRNSIKNQFKKNKFTNFTDDIQIFEKSDQKNEKIKKSNERDVTILDKIKKIRKKIRKKNSQKKID